jgi:branched-chain amino acid aminotransferase
MSIRITKCSPLPALKTPENPKFGTQFAPHMLKLELKSNDFSDLKAEIIPYAAQPMHPSALVLHYGQSIFEGMKAYRLGNGGVGIFRLDLHAKRFENSCKIMSMPPLPPEIFETCLKEYVAFERDSVPSYPDHSLYLRPVMFPVDKLIKMGRGNTYDFYIISAVAGNYFAGKAGIGAKVLVNRQFVRAYPGGLGEAKTAANYAASLAPLDYAAKNGCDQLLYLQAVDHDHVDELGGMNFFIVRGNTIVTPPLTGTVLNGVTRKSILELASSLGLQGKEEPISFTRLMEEIASGKVTECFACGTAAVVQSLGELLYQDKIGGELKPIKLKAEYKVANAIHDQLRKIQRGLVQAPAKWLSEV